MARQLVICLDGTNNRFSQQPTHILRLVRALDPDPQQVLSYYDQGVGTFGLKETLFEWQKLPARIFGLAFGWGLKRNVEGAYRFLAEQYQPGDQVFVFGFSRGAYAARALAALVHGLGLVAAHQTHLFDYAWSMLLARDKDKNNEPDFALQRQFKETFGRDLDITFLGLFDTVKSLGWIYDPVSIPYTASNPSVLKVRHAVSLDERRCFFRQHLWRAKPTDSTDVKEVFFRGVHCDVGGGYAVAESPLALVALRWMFAQAGAAGLALDAQACQAQLNPLAGVAPDPLANSHDSMNHAWRVAEWVPRLVWSKGRRKLVIGAMPPFRQPYPRVLPNALLVHESVDARIKAGGYASASIINGVTQVTYVADLP
ncbi:hypothetical protein D3C77_142690 [compost metagenome]